MSVEIESVCTVAVDIWSPGSTASLIQETQTASDTLW